MEVNPLMRLSISTQPAFFRQAFCFLRAAHSAGSVTDHPNKTKTTTQILPCRVRSTSLSLWRVSCINNQLVAHCGAPAQIKRSQGRLSRFYGRVTYAALQVWATKQSRHGCDTSG